MLESIPVNRDMQKSVEAFLTEHWGSPVIVSRGRLHQAHKLQGFAVLSGEDVKGLITFNIIDDECEIVSLDSLLENRGIGTALIARVTERAREARCKKIVLVTTNDNTKAIRFYQKRGFNMAGLRLNAVPEARGLKPQIPTYGSDGIPILHEIVFEKAL